MAPQVGVIIPARNEADALPPVLAALPREHITQIIVADNGSTDATAKLARAAGATVVSVPEPGYGRACLAGISALNDGLGVVVFLDGDYSDYPEQLPALIEPILRDRADLVIGSRVRLAERGSLTPQQRFGNALACLLIRRLYGTRFTDLGPFRAIRKASLDALAMDDLNFGWTVQMQVRAAKQGLRCREVDVRYRPRIGRSKISGTLRGTVLAGTVILKTLFKELKKAEDG